MQLIKYVLNKTVTLDELIEAGLQPEKVESIRQNLAEREKALYLRVQELRSLEACNDYLGMFPKGTYASEVNAIIEAIEDEPWAEAKRIGTIEAYRAYVQEHPGKHVEEVTCLMQAEEFLEALHADPNAYNVHDIKNFVSSGAATWEEIGDIFPEKKIRAIQQFVQPTHLPESTPPDALQKGSTEVYFWGTPSSGKTCALGALISSVNSKGILDRERCSGYDYMTRLSNIFGGKEICTFPPSTAEGSIQEMIMKLSDEKDRQHRITLIDLAGELFRSVYKKNNNIFLNKEQEETLAKAISYLMDNRNRKIHFFVVEYGADEKEWEGLKMENYLVNMMGFLRENQVLRNSSIGVYVLVTKCDRIPGNRDSRPKAAYDYICEKMPSFWNALQLTCKKAGVRDLSILAYSVGDVFAQNLCIFDPADTDKVIKRLLNKTPTTHHWWDWLKK